MKRQVAVSFRLTERDVANIAAIQKAEPYLSKTAALRMALEEAAKKRKKG